MKARHIIALLLVLAMSLATAASPARARLNLRADAEDEPKLTPEEELEARDLVASFDERWRATHDFEQIIDELFVKDFPERLRQAPTDDVPWWVIDKSLLAYASPAELRRYYVASLNCFGLVFKLYEVTAALNKQSGSDEDEVNLEDALSPEVINMLLRDPALAELINDAQKDDGKDENTKENDNSQPAESVDSTQAAGAASQADDDGATKTSEIETIKSLSQLNSLAKTLEQANELMRKRLASLPALPPPASNSDDTDTQTESQQPGLRFNLIRLDESFYGCTQGTQLVHVDLLPFCLRLIKVDGQLKLLSVAIYID